ncbi:hypothetical protein WJ969_03665 [Achromobacter xylosoxidans]
MRRTCISLWLTPWVVLRAISRTCGMNRILTGPADHCRTTPTCRACAPRALLPRCRDKPRRPPRRSALPRLHASRRPTRQEIPGSFFQRTRTCFVGSEIQFLRVLVFNQDLSTLVSIITRISRRRHFFRKTGFQNRVFQELKPAATSNLHRCSKT